MATIITRAGKGSPLTNAEVDANFTNLNSDKLETAGGTLTGPTVVNVNSTSTALRVTQTGTGAALVVEDEANPDATAFVITNAGNVGVGTPTPAVKFAVNSTDAILVPVGDTAARPTGAAGYLRFNSGTTSFEGHNGTAWGSIGGGATGGGSDQCFYLNSTTVNNSYSIPAGQNAGTFGPVTVASGAIITVPSGSTWTIV